VHRAHAEAKVVDAGAADTSAADTSAADTAHDARGEEALKKALTRLKSSSAAERAEAADEMGRRGHRFRKQIAESLRPLLLADPDSVVRAAAGRALGRLGAREAVPELIKALGDKTVEVRVVSAAALWRLPDPSAVPALLERVKDDDRAVREWSALALGVAADPRAVPELILLLDDRERPVRLAAVRSLGRINRPEGLKPLTHYLLTGKHDDEEKEEVVNSIASIEGTARVGALLELLAAPGIEASHKLRLVRALGKVGDAQAISALRKLALHRDESKALREAANQAVAAVVARAKAAVDAGPPAARP
jgi:HEAT repeat protein